MMPHIYNSLRGYPDRWVCSLEGGPNLTVTEVLECMDCTFGDVHEYNTMIHPLYEIRQKDRGVHVVNPRGCHSYSSCLPRLCHGPREEFGMGLVLSWHSTQLC